MRSRDEGPCSSHVCVHQFAQMCFCSSGFLTASAVLKQTAICTELRPVCRSRQTQHIRTARQSEPKQTGGAMTRVNIRRAWFSVKQTTGGDCGMFVISLLTDVLPITTTFDSYCVPHTHILNEGIIRRKRLS